jgi:hypothetical protein
VSRCDCQNQSRNEAVPADWSVGSRVHVDFNEMF